MKLNIHPLAEVLRPMSPAEYKMLRDDIEQHGVNEPIVLFEGKILDGRHRYRAACDVGIKPDFTEFVGDAKQAEALVYSSNIARRHLTLDERKAFIHRAIMINPTESNPKIAERTGVSKETVRRVRDEVEAELPADVRAERVRKAIEEHPTASTREIARKAGVPRETARRLGDPNGTKVPNGSPKPRVKRKKETQAERRERIATQTALAETAAIGKSLITTRCATLVRMLDAATEFNPQEVQALVELRDRIAHHGALK